MKSGILSAAGLGLLAALWLCGCRTMTLPPVNLADPGWSVRQGQAVWQPTHTAPELTGELLFASRGNGDSFFQFTKNPFPMVTGQTTSNRWRVEFSAANKKYSAPGSPPQRLLWFQLAPLTRTNHLRLENPRTGEALEVYLNP